MNKITIVMVLICIIIGCDALDVDKPDNTIQ